MKNLKQEVQNVEEWVPYKDTNYFKVAVKGIIIGGILVGGCYLATNPEALDTVKNYLFRFWH